MGRNISGPSTQPKAYLEPSSVMMNIAPKTVLEKHETRDLLPSISFLSHYLLPGAAPEWFWAEPRPWLWAVATEQKSIGNKLSTENLM